jgi:multidrug resistance efflux pump
VDEMRAAGPITQRDVEAIVAAVIKTYDAKMAQAVAMIDSRDTELATLRADLAEARADVARFEAALDAANRELAQALASARRKQALDAAPKINKRRKE